MSEFFSGITFAEQKVTPTDDAVVRRTVLPDGIVTGCELSYSGSTLTMAAGYIMACGRLFRHTSVENWAVVDATSGYARLVITLDLTRTATKDTFDQINAEIEYATAADGFSGLIQSDINAAGSKYQIEVCVVSLGTGGITGIVSQIDLATGGGIKMEKIWENARPDSAITAGTTVTVDIAKYEMFAVRVKMSTTLVGTNIFMGFPNSRINAALGSTGGKLSLRTVDIGTAETNKITFNAGYAEGTADTKAMIPLDIYGIKGVTM